MSIKKQPLAVTLLGLVCKLGREHCYICLRNVNPAYHSQYSEYGTWEGVDYSASVSYLYRGFVFQIYPYRIYQNIPDFWNHWGDKEDTHNIDIVISFFVILECKHRSFSEKKVRICLGF